MDKPKAVFSTRHFYDARDRKVKWENDKPGFMVWHVEHNEAVNFEILDSWLDFPMPDFAELARNGEKYEIDPQVVVNFCFPDENEGSVDWLDKAVQKVIDKWGGGHITRNEKFRRFSLDTIKRIEKLLELSDYEAALNTLKYLKRETENASIV
jgi:hypothetical protein